MKVLTEQERAIKEAGGAYWQDASSRWDGRDVCAGVWRCEHGGISGVGVPGRYTPQQLKKHFYQLFKQERGCNCCQIREVWLSQTIRG